jgi:UDP-GlcNAc:undecaprenyl-phosphate GlcNAc-1-phosphate transferase
MGGVAIVAAYVVAIFVALSVGHGHGIVRNRAMLWSFLVAGGLIAVVGAVDDIRALGAKRKLFWQTAVATIAWTGGVRIASKIFVPGLGYLFIGEPLSYLATVVWILAFINAINLIDGLDGLAGGVVFFATTTNVVVAIVTGNLLAAILNASLGGAVLGFLFYNFNPATIFMGDTGSMFLGYALGSAALITGTQKESTLVSLLVPVIALGLPFTDTLLATMRRVAARRSIFSADREHLHHRLLDLGLTHRRAVLIMYCCTSLLCLAALAAALGRSWQVGAAIGGAVLALVGMTRFAGYFEMLLLKRRERADLLKGPTEAMRRTLPSLILSAESSNSASGVWAALERMLSAGYFIYGEYCPNGEGPTWKWECSEQQARDEGKLLETQFPIRAFPGALEGTLRFGWLSTESELPPQIEVLLQMAADAVETSLVRVHVQAPAQLRRAVVSRPS